MPRASAYECLLQLEHVLESCNLKGLAHFIPTEAQDSSSLLNLPTLITHSDSGSDIFAAWCFSQWKLGARQWHFGDPRHANQRVLENAAKLAGVSGSLGLFNNILTLNEGPWQEHKWWGTIREEAWNYLWMSRNAGAEKDAVVANPLVRRLLPQIIREAGWSNLLEKDVIRLVHERLQEASFLKRKGSSGSDTRWDEFHSQFRERKAELSLLYLLLLSYGVQCGYLQTKDMESENVNLSVEALPAEEGQSIKTARQKQDDLYNRCRNKLHVATVILAQEDVPADVCLKHAFFPVLSSRNIIPNS